MFPPHVQSEIALVAGAELRLQTGWPDAVAVRLWQQSMWYELPYFFLPAFPSLSLPAVRPLALFGRLFASSIFLHDPIADRDVLAHDAARTTLRIMAMQLEAYRALHGAFVPGAALWDRLRSYLSDYAAACLDELDIASGARPWRDYTEDMAIRIAIGKSGLSRAIVAGLVELAHDETLLEPLLASLDHFNIACQMWDDLKDWRDDLQHGMPSLLLSRVVSERPARGELAGAIDRVARELYYGGHANYVLERALAALDVSERLKQRVPDLPWYRMADVIRSRLQDTLRDLTRIIDRNVERARRHAPSELTPSEEQAP